MSNPLCVFLGMFDNDLAPLKSLQLSIYRSLISLYDDLLSAGPKELRPIHHRIRIKYLKNIERKELQWQKRRQRQQKVDEFDPITAPSEFAMDLFTLG